MKSSSCDKMNKFNKNIMNNIYSIESQIRDLQVSLLKWKNILQESTVVIPQSETSVPISSNASLIKTLNKNIVERMWPYMRVKNTIKLLGLGSTRISHYDGLQLLATTLNLDIHVLLTLYQDTYSYKYRQLKNRL